MHGLGNDFVIFDGRIEPLVMTSPLARLVADRRRGIGCDQLIVLEPSTSADVRMSIWNADGSAAEACGNATRCVVALTGAARIETDGGILSGLSLNGDVEVVLDEPRFEWTAIPLADAMDTRALPMAWDEYAGPAAVNVGNPHLVFFVEAIDEARMELLGPRIEHDLAFPQRINVNVARVAEDGAIELRTFERGVGLTDACGTGACATAVVAIREKRVSSPVTVRMKGGNLTIGWVPGGPIVMRGPSAAVFSGEIDLAGLGA